MLSTISTKENMVVVFDYLFRKIDKATFKKLIGPEAKEVWLKVKDNGYILKNCKLFAYAVHYSRIVSSGAVSPGKYGIHSEDVHFLRRLDLSHIPKRYKAYTLREYELLAASIYTQVDSTAWVGKFISRKLIFLTRSFGLKREDIESNLYSSLWYSLCKQYPMYKSDLHALNICKASMHNSGQALIEFHTRKKRQALQKVNGSFQAVNDSNLNSLSVPPEHENDFRLNIQSLVQLYPKLSGRARIFASSAAGIYDAGFSRFLGRRNDDAVDTLPYTRYMELLRTYVGVSYKQQQGLFKSIKEHL